MEEAIFTSSEAIDAVEFGDRTIEIIGYVQQFSPQRNTGNSEFFKFILSNGAGKKIQCCAWGAADIDAIEREVLVNNILHIDGAWARVPSKEEYNKGNCHFELQLFATTAIECFGQHLEAIEEDDLVDTIVLPNVVHCELGTKIKIVGYLRTVFVEQRLCFGSQVGTFGCGSITDGTNKLEVRVASILELPNYQKGQKVEITGTVEHQGLRFYLQINNFNDIKVIEDKIMPLGQLLAGYKDYKRPLTDFEQPSTSR
ncbi:uncharacterized protein LOC122503282 [Leptopilina heterotoma]|uniref:uncharacterized protein LOC122503282 n=1 Tax=Leptopilina heterotoma TaxID=63436 RepID=UPI001CA9F13F|nr:uncharacterized protein LOC122503282 [Leptopilina heterotoma]